MCLFKDILDKYSKNIIRLHTGFFIDSDFQTDLCKKSKIRGKGVIY